MTVDLRKLSEQSQAWLIERAERQGIAPQAEAFVLLDDAIRDRMRREASFRNADAVRVRLPGPPLTAEEIEDAINWGR